MQAGSGQAVSGDRREAEGASSNETIFAEATAPGRSAVAILRISGPAAGSVAGRFGVSLPAPRVGSVRRLIHAGEPIDEALVLWFPRPDSYTGEDVLELHVHGGTAVVSGVLAVLAETPGCRVALPGEFTRRAVEAGKMDLAAAEAVGDLVDAETSLQRRQAVDQLTGGLSARIWEWREALLSTLAMLEASIDFSDEELPDDLVETIDARLGTIRDDLADALARGRLAEIVRRGVRLAVVGPPNAGKSTFVNWLAGRDVAIVSSIPGTTRDVVECVLDLDGVKVTVADTAGLRETVDPIEKEGVDRARRWAEGADIRILFLDGSADAPLDGLWRDIDPAIIVASKADLGRAAWVPKTAIALSLTKEPGHEIGHEAGPERVLAGVSLAVRKLLGGFGAGDSAAAPGGGGLMTRERHRHAARDALAALVDVETARGNGEPIEIQAELLRRAARSLGRVTGAVDVEDVLDRLFASFCIGK